jgi:predicted  nucleic acid-binding Zn-ribbon protein
MEMFTVENKTGAVKQVARARSSAGADVRQLKVLCERLLRVQPQSEPLLKRLLARSRRVGRHCAFATIQDGRCSACNMTVAIARIQKAKAGEFINCAHCIRFLYHDSR